MAPLQEIRIREAREDDVPAIRNVFLEVYGTEYRYQGFYDDWWLKRSVFVDDILMLVAEDESGEVLGTASVIFDIGSYSDLAAEFGRLAVRPSARGRGVGGLLMQGRITAAEGRLHVGVVENRCAHTYSQKISLAQGFAPVGFLPMKYMFQERESLALFARHFGGSLELRKNHPHVVPEVGPLAHLALESMGMPDDLVLDDEAAPYHTDRELALDGLEGDGVPSLVRIQRGRVSRRELFGPVQLHHGFFKLSARRATYLIARHGHGGPVAGAIGYIHDEYEQTVSIIELISQTDEAIRFLLEALVARYSVDLGVAYIEATVNAHAPRMQRTLIELGFIATAFVPGLVFQKVERLDAIKMAKVLVPVDRRSAQLIPEMQPIADLVCRDFERQSVQPQVAQAVYRLRLFQSMNSEQVQCVASLCSVEHHAVGARLFARGTDADSMIILIDGRVEVVCGDPVRKLGEVGAGESLGELAMLTGEPHSADAVAIQPVIAAVLPREALSALTRRRPDIGVLLYRQLALGIGDKLRRADLDRLDC